MNLADAMPIILLIATNFHAMHNTRIEPRRAAPRNGDGDGDGLSELLGRNAINLACNRQNNGGEQLKCKIADAKDGKEERD